MKKVKFALIFAFSAALTLGFAACSKPDDYAIERIRFSGGNTVTLTDAQAADEKSGTKAFEAQAEQLALRVYADESRYTVSGEDCTFDTSAVTWGEVGTYTVQMTPKKNNANGLSAQVVLTIGHEIGEPDPVTGIARCVHCGKVEYPSSFDPAVEVEYGAFHGGYTAESTVDPDGLVKPFGTVTAATGTEEVGTYTVGKLRKGMTISITGTAQSNPNAGEDSWYYPILGIAIRDFDPATVQSPYSTEAYTGGASVLIRNDAWVLLNGIGDPTRLLAGFAGGTGESYNYGSVPGSSTSTAPAGYNPNSMPASAEEWAPWYVYSSGTQLYTPNYATAQEVTFSWQFREDNVIVVTNRNNTTGTSLVSYIRVPDALGESTFDTVLHGENVSMRFTSASALQSDLLDNVTAQLTSSAKRAYVEGETLNMEELSVRIAFESAPHAYEITTDYTLQAYIGDAATAEDAQKDEAVESWTDVTADTPLSADWRFFRVRTIVGGRAAYAYLNVGYSNFLTDIAPNQVGDIVSAKIVRGSVVYQSHVANMLAYGELACTAGTAGEGGATVVSVAPTGVPDAVPSGAPAGYTHFMAFRLYARDGETFGTPAAAPAGVTLSRAKDGSYLDVLVLLNADMVAANDLYLRGVQTTPVRIDLAGITLPAARSSVTANGAGKNEVPVNMGGDVQVTYTFDGLSLEAFNGNRGAVQLGTSEMVNVPASSFVWEGNNFTYGAGLALGTSTVGVSGSASERDGKLVLTVEYDVPALPLITDDTHPGYVPLRMTYNGVTLTDTIYYTEPVEGEGTEGFVLTFDGVDVWFNVQNATVYYAVVGYDRDNIVDRTIKLPSFYININAGEATSTTAYGFLNAQANVKMQDGVLVTEGRVPAEGNPFSSMLRIFGTANDGRDADRGWLVMGSVSGASYGISLNTNSTVEGEEPENVSSYYFEICGGEPGGYGEARYYKVTYTAPVLNSNFEQIRAASLVWEDVTQDVAEAAAEAETVAEYGENALGITAKTIAGGAGDTQFGLWYEIGRVHMHDWKEVAGNHYLYKCEDCGAVLNSTPVSISGDNGTTAANGTYVSAALLGENVAETGMTLSFLLKQGSSDFDNTLLATKTGNLQITLPNLQGNVSAATEPTGIDGHLWDIVAGRDSEAKKSKNLTANNDATRAEGIEWDTLLNTPDVYVTVVISPGTDETDGVLYYVNGELWYHYEATKIAAGMMVANFVDAFLQCAQMDGVYVNGAKLASPLFATDDFILESRALTEGSAFEWEEDETVPADEVSARYSAYRLESRYYPDQHVYNTAVGSDGYGKCTHTGCGAIDPHHTHQYVEAATSTDYDHCTICGQLHPDHGNTEYGGKPHVYDGTHHCYGCGQLDPAHTEHEYVKGVCACGEICKHNFADGVCTVCGAERQTVEVDNVSYGGGTPWSEDYSYKLPIQFRYADTITIEGTQTGDISTNWETALVRLSAGGKSYTIRLDRWTFGDNVLFATGAPASSEMSVTDAEGTVKATGDGVWSYFAGICKNSTWAVTLTWMPQDTLQISIEVTSADGTSFNCVETYGAVANADTVFDVIVSAEGVDGWSVTSYSSIGFPSEG